MRNDAGDRKNDFSWIDYKECEEVLLSSGKTRGKNNVKEPVERAMKKDSDRAVRQTTNANRKMPDRPSLIIINSIVFPRRMYA